MNPSDDDEFYVGYLDPAPPRTGRWLRRLVPALIIGGAFLSGALVAALRPFDAGALDPDAPRDYEGVIAMEPAPSLIIERPGVPGTLGGFSRYLLAAPGKFGAAPQVAALAGKAVRLRAWAVYRDGQTLLKLDGRPPEALPPDGLSHAAAAEFAAAPRVIGPVELTGEIVDPQCFLGLMKPGYGVPHRACAIRCLAGGVPPVFFSHDDFGLPHYHLLVGEGGASINQAVLPRIAERFQVRGTEVAYGDLLAVRVALPLAEPP